MTRLFVQRARLQGDGSSSRRLRRAGLGVGLAALAVVGCSGPSVPLSVGLADRPVDLLLGERIKSLDAMPVPPAVPPLVLPDFDLPLPAPMPLDLTSVPPTVRATFPTWPTTTTTIPVGCTATPPDRVFSDSPDNVILPPLETPEGEKGYAARTSGKIEVGGDTVAETPLPQLTTRRIENIQVLSRFPAAVPVGKTVMYSDKRTIALGAPSEYTFDVVSDVGKAENNTRTTYRVQPGWQDVTFRDSWSLVRGHLINRPDGVIDDYFTDLNGDWDVADPNEQRPDLNNSKTVDYPADYGYVDKNGNGSIDYPDEYYYDTNGNGKFDDPDEYHFDENGNGKIDYPYDPDGDGPEPPVTYTEENYANDLSYWSLNLKPDGKPDFLSFKAFNGGFYLVSTLTGTKEANRITFSKVKNGTGQLVDAPGALLATLPLVESATINTEAYTANGSTSIRFESTVFGRVDVDVCRTDLVAWKVALDRGFISSPSSAVEFTSEYAIGGQYGGLFLSEKSVMTSIQAGSPSVKRTVESVFTTEPPAAADPDPPTAR